MMDILIEPPGFMSGMLEQWQRHLAQLRELPDDPIRDLAIKTAEREIGLREKSDPRVPSSLWANPPKK